jgi:hypothetical protein
MKNALYINDEMINNQSDDTLKGVISRETATY